MVWRRADELHARLRMTQTRDQLRNLVTRKLSTLAGLRALCNLDLDLFSIHQVFRTDAEARGGNLLDLVIEEMRRNTCAVQRQLALRVVHRAVFPAFTRVGAPAEHIHCSSDRLVRLRAERTERHGTRDKPLIKVLRRLNLVYWQRNARRSKLKQIAQNSRFLFYRNVGECCPGLPRLRHSGSAAACRSCNGL